MATSFCAVSDIARYTQTVIDGSSKPTSTETQSFADERAAVIVALCFRLGTAVDPNTFDVATPLGRLLRAANAIGAALDWIEANTLAQSPQAIERIPLLQKLWQQYTGLWDGVSPQWIRGEGFISLLIKGSLAVTHITSGAESEDVDVPGITFDEKL
jgi:hypothetical protein